MRGVPCAASFPISPPDRLELIFGFGDCIFHYIFPISGDRTMAEFRIEGLSLNGKPVQGIINADSMKLAKERAQQMARERKFKLTSVLARSTFLYRVKRGDEKPTDGEQKAFSKQEVMDALTKMGYKVIFVRKKLFDSVGTVPPIEVVAFVRVSADLIKQKLPFNEMMAMLINDVQNKNLRECIRDINQELKRQRKSLHKT
jgi:type IV pilus assembly protein PilC